MKESYASFRKSKWFPLVAGVISCILGVVCLMNPQCRMESIAFVAGVIFILYGVLEVLTGLRIQDNTALRVVYVILGVIAVILGILVFANLELIGKYLPTLAGFFMIVSAVTTLLPSFILLKNGLKSWWYAALPAIILLILGLIFLLNPGFVGQTFGIFAGIAFLVNGISNLIGFMQMNK